MINQPFVLGIVATTAVLQLWRISIAWRENRHRDPRRWTSQLITEVGLLALLLFGAALIIRAP